MKNSFRTTLFLSLLLLGALAASPAHAAPGDLDPGFGTRGKAVRDFGGEDRIVDVAVQGKRKALALVQADAGDERIFVMRLRSNGRLDRAFGTNGRTRIDRPGDEYAGGIDLRSDGRVVVSFTSDPSEADSAFGVARLLRNGNLDRSFDNDGIQTSGFGTGFSDARVSDVAIDGNRIIVAGWVWAGADTSDDFALARFDSTGQLDAAFAGDGRQTTDFAAERDVALGVEVDSQRRPVAVGYAAPAGPGVDPLALARYGADGELDASFSGDGRVVSEVAPEGQDLVVLGDDRIVVAGTVSGDYVVARFGEGGALDGSFGAGGSRAIDFNDGADAVGALARDGSRLVVAGTARTPRRGRDFGIARLRPNGSLDPRFSDDGLRTVNFDGREDQAYGVAVDRTRDVVAVGSAQVPRRDTAALRLQGRGGR